MIYDERNDSRYIGMLSLALSFYNTTEHGREKVLPGFQKKMFFEKRIEVLICV